MALEQRILKQVVRGFLLLDSGIVAKVDDRIFGAHIMDSDAQTVAHPMIVFDFLSGNARWHTGSQTQTIEMYTYSKVSGDEADEIYDLVFNLIQHECMTITGVTTRVLSQEIQRPVGGWNAATRSWFTRGRWQLSST